MNTNQIIHERLMGECLHEPKSPVKRHGEFTECIKCGNSVGFLEGIPNYREDLNLAFAAQAKAIERFGESVYCFALLKIIGTNSAAIIADAKTRCAAIVKLLENDK